jgi:opacity protein-like surface antigen
MFSKHLVTSSPRIHRSSASRVAGCLSASLVAFLCTVLSGCSTPGRDFSVSSRPLGHLGGYPQDVEDQVEQLPPGVPAAERREGRSFEAETGFYVSALLPYSTVGGDFGGDTALVGLDEAIIVPELDGGFGYGLGLGWRLRRLALELNYMQTSHDATVLGMEMDPASVHAVNFDMKYFLMVEQRFQPFLLFGLGLGWIDLPGASVNSSGSVGDATLRGLCLDLGGGASYYLRDDLSLDFGLSYRWMNLNSASGVNGEGQPIDDSLDASGMRAVLGLTYTF